MKLSSNFSLQLRSALKMNQNRRRNLFLKKIKKKERRKDSLVRKLRNSALKESCVYVSCVRRCILKHPVVSQIVKVTTGPDALNVDDQRPSHCLLRDVLFSRSPVVQFNQREHTFRRKKKRIFARSESLLFDGPSTRELF